MKLLRLILLLTCLIRTASAASDSLLEHVPADTPFLYAVTEPLSEDVAKRWFDFKNSMAMNRLQLQLMLDKDAARPKDDLGLRMDASVRHLLTALRDELEFTSQEEFARRTGLQLGGRLVIYGVGLLPVARLELADVAAFRKLLKRLKRAWGVPTWTLKGQDTEDENSWVLVLDDFQLVIQIDGKQLVLALLPQEVVAQSVVLSASGKPYGAEQHARFNRERGHSGFGSGFIDLPATARLLFATDDSPTRRAIKRWISQLPQLDRVCRDELEALLVHSPLLTYGMGTVDSGMLEFKSLLAVDSELGRDLDRIAAAAPALPRAGSQMGMAVALDVLALVEVLKSRADAMANAPFQCQSFAGLNTGMAALRKGLDQVTPAMFDGHTGFAMLFHEFDFSAAEQDSTQFSVLLRSRNPAGLFGLAQLTTPGLDGISLKPDGEPLRLDAPELAPEWRGGTLVMTEDLLAFSTAEDAADRLRSLVAVTQPRKSPLLQFNAAGTLFETMADAMGKFATQSGEDPAALVAVESFYRELAQSVDRLDMRLNLGPRGLEFHFAMSHSRSPDLGLLKDK